MLKDFVDPQAQGPPMFPAPEKTLRDEFAFAALQGLLSTSIDYYDAHHSGWAWFAKAAYSLADEMLEIRGK